MEIKDLLFLIFCVTSIIVLIVGSIMGCYRLFMEEFFPEKYYFDLNEYGKQFHENPKEYLKRQGWNVPKDSKKK